MSNLFLVYEHWRPDTGTCFYVGKGKRKRASSLEPRNSRHGRIVAKLARKGIAPIVKIVSDGLAEFDAFRLEVERIAYWRAQGIEIANYTTGGDGPSGMVHSDETKEKIRAKAKGRKWSDAHRAKRAAQKRQPHTDQTKAKMSASAKVAQKKRFENVKKSKAGRTGLKKQMLRMSRIAASDPGVRAVRSTNAKALWADPEYRARRASRSLIRGFS